MMNKNNKFPAAMEFMINQWTNKNSDDFSKWYVYAVKKKKEKWCNRECLGAGIGSPLDEVSGEGIWDLNEMKSDLWGSLG